tara:strand:+ start:8154 stop:9521 length:1368 start_codon:yes stop_codon:yes gene_type:complete
MKTYLIFGWIPMIFVLFSCSAQQKIESIKPNFVIVIADDAAWDDSGAYGNTVIRTPSINKLAEEGLVFDNAYLTTSSCSPSRCSILTGRYPHSTGAPELHQPLPKNQILFPGELQKVGYYTAAAGKYHIGPKRAEFDSIYPAKDDSGCGNWLRSLENRPKDKPFFLWLASKDPHRPYKDSIIEIPHDPLHVIVPPYLPDTPSVRTELAQYYDEISRVDSYIGLVLKELEKQNVADNTVVIYMSDNGRPFPRAKTRLYDSGIKTPFIIRWPKQIKIGRTNSLISSIDIATTICELGGTNIPREFQGTSFSKLLYEPKESVRAYVAAEHNWHDYQASERAIRTSKYLYIHNRLPQLNASPPADAVNSPSFQSILKLYKEGKLKENHQDSFTIPRKVEELYDLQNDPFQLKNIVGDSRFSDILIDMRDLYAQWSEKYEDKLPDKFTPDKFDRSTGEKL